MNTINVGDKVMVKNEGLGLEIYEVVSDVQSRDRVLIENKFGTTKRVSINSLRKMSGVELSLINAFVKLMKDVTGEQLNPSYRKKFKIGDKVMWRYDVFNFVYKVTQSFPTTRERVVVNEVNQGFPMRVSQNSLRKVSEPELCILRGIKKLCIELSGK